MPRLTRVAATALVGLASLLCIYLGALALDAQDSITAMTIILVAVGTPWAAIVGVGYIACRGSYLRDDLQVFNRRERGGAYWFTAGWNLRALVAWSVGATFGALAVNTTLYKGPLADIAEGVDISFLASGAIAGVLYLILRIAFPERAERRTPAGSAGAENPLSPVPELRTR